MPKGEMGRRSLECPAVAVLATPMLKSTAKAKGGEREEGRSTRGQMSSGDKARCISIHPEEVSKVQPVRSAVKGVSRRGPGWEELTWRVALPREEETRKGRYSNPKKPNQREGGRDTPAMLEAAEPRYAERIGGRGGEPECRRLHKKPPAVGPRIPQWSLFSHL